MVNYGQIKFVLFKQTRQRVIVGCSHVFLHREWPSSNPCPCSPDGGNAPCSPGFDRSCFNKDFTRTGGISNSSISHASDDASRHGHAVYKLLRCNLATRGKSAGQYGCCKKNLLSVQMDRQGNTISKTRIFPESKLSLISIDNCRRRHHTYRTFDV